MNIELKLSIDEIKLMQQIIVITRNVMITMRQRDQIFVFSIVLDIGQKIDKKALSLDNDFGTIGSKRYKVKFKYHEAVILEKFVVDMTMKETDPYSLTLVRNIANQINQKLA